MIYSYKNTQANSKLFQKAMQIYRDSFDEEEREDEKSISQNIENSNYKMLSCLCDGELVGFYILDINKKFDYALLSFLAIKKSWQSQGLGTKLSLHAIDYFKTELQESWLLIEAKDRQAKLYEKIGFHKLKLEYHAPLFNSQESTPMHLMLIKKQKTLDTSSLKNIIKDIFHRGYALASNDIRVLEQLNKISI